MSGRPPSPAADDLWRRRALYALSWELFDAAVRSIAGQLRTAGQEVDCILGISRGGLVPAVALCNMLDITTLQVIAVGRNVGTGQYLAKRPPRVLWQGDLSAVRGKQVLVVDDVTGTGETLRHVREQVLLAGAADVRTAVLVRMRRGTGGTDFYAVELDDWVVFPWEGAELPEGAVVKPVVMPGREREQEEDP